MRCLYCHNPDTWAFEGGREATVEELLQRIRRCAPYIKKGGGVTVTGGEPLAQSEFVAALFAQLRTEALRTRWPFWSLPGKWGCPCGCGMWWCRA